MPATMFKGKSELGYRGDVILEMDWVVGEITKQLNELGLTKNTIIIFSSDNGPVLDDGYADDAVAKNGSHKPAGPYRGWKTDIYEGGNRIPFIFSWPKNIKPGVSSAMVNQIDFIASFAKLLHVNIPQGEAPDSENMLNAFLGKSREGRTIMVEEGYHNLAIVDRNWKYIEPFGNHQAQLYDLSKDAGETNDLAGKCPDKVKELEKSLNEIRTL
jgi:arylsulfatase A